MKKLALTLMFLLACQPPAFAGFVIDTSGAPNSTMTGMWWNQNESGWGAAIVQQYATIFLTIYTYDNGNPVWYVASNCPVSGNSCTGFLYKVLGGVDPTAQWDDKYLSVRAVGAVGLAFADADNGTMSFTINGVSGSRPISRLAFAVGPESVAAPTATTITLATAGGSPSAPPSSLAKFSGATVNAMCSTQNCAPTPKGSSCVLSPKNQVQVSTATAAYQTADGRTLWLGIEDPNNAMQVGVPNLSSVDGPLVSVKFSDRFSQTNLSYPSWYGTTKTNKSSGSGSVTITAASATSLDLSFSNFLLNGAPSSILLNGSVKITCDPNLAQ